MIGWTFCLSPHFQIKRMLIDLNHCGSVASAKVDFANPATPQGSADKTWQVHLHKLIWKKWFGASKLLNSISKILNAIPKLPGIWQHCVLWNTAAMKIVASFIWIFISEYALYSFAIDLSNDFRTTSVHIWNNLSSCGFFSKVSFWNVQKQSFESFRKNRGVRKWQSLLSFSLFYLWSLKLSVHELAARHCSRFL